MTARPVCSFCNSDDSSPALSAFDIKGRERVYYHCRSCRTVFLWPVPVPDELAEYYSDEYYGKSDAKFEPGIVEKILDAFRKKRAAHIAALTGGKGRVLDIGCGNGMLLHHLSQMGEYELYASELPGRQAERAQAFKEINLHIGPFTGASYAKASFDCISLFHVFEHLDKASLIIAQIDELLKPGGKLIFSFPNICSWQAKIFKGHWLHLDPPRHLFLPYSSAFRDHMQSRGYDLIRERFFSPEQNPFGLLQSLLNVFSVRRDGLFEGLKGNRGKESGLSGPVFLLQLIFAAFHAVHAILIDAFESLAGRGATIEMTFVKKQ